MISNLSVTEMVALFRAIGELSRAMGNPAVTAKFPESIYSAVVRLAIERLKGE